MIIFIFHSNLFNSDPLFHTSQQACFYSDYLQISHHYDNVEDNALLMQGWKSWIQYHYYYMSEKVG